jgi:hypothetical protein
MRWPPVGHELWKAFAAMGRQSGMGGPLPLTQAEVQAWQFNHGVRFTPWELEMIKAFDAVALDHARKKAAP